MSDLLDSKLSDAERAAIISGVAEILREDLRVELEAMAARHLSPWRNRTTAAAYLQQSKQVVDHLFGQGRLEKHFVGTTPLVKVAELDRVIEEDTKIQRRKLASKSLAKPRAEALAGPQSDLSS